jgi:N6-adenosine-specific RNA methylase IME4
MKKEENQTEILAEVESPEKIYGRLCESVHVTTYSMERACQSLEYLLGEDRWKTVGNGQEEIDVFLKNIDLSSFKIAADRRKNLAIKLEALAATQRATAKALGVGVATVNRDLDPVPTGTKPKTTPQQKQALIDDVVPSGTPPPTPPPASIPQSGADVARVVEKVAASKEKKEDNARSKKELLEQPLPEDKYRVFYADPPWTYTSGDQHSTEEQATVLGTHYPSMTIAELCDMDIKSMAADDAVLFLWVTSPLLEEAFVVIRAWGFEYKTSMVWDKVKHNVGHYVSVRHEFILICTKGSCKPDVPTLHNSVLRIERTEHSRKPEEVRKIIDEIYPAGKRTELFARGKVPEHWDTWGNEA